MKIAVLNTKKRIINVIEGDDSYLSDNQKFLSVESSLWIDDTYSDDLALVENYEKESQSEKRLELIPINLLSVDGAQSVSSDMTKITALEGQGDLMLTGQIPIPDRTFVTPIEKVNVSTGDAQIFYKQISVVNEQFSVSLNLASGKYRLTQELMNAEFSEPMFTMKPIQIYVTI